MSKLDHTWIDLTITIAGIERTVEARVEYIHSPAFAATVERGSGVHTQAAEGEGTEITSVRVAENGVETPSRKPALREIMHLLTDEQLDAIQDEILGD